MRFKEGLGEVREKGAREQRVILTGDGGIQKNAQKRSSEPTLGCRPAIAVTLQRTCSAPEKKKKQPLGNLAWAPLRGAFTRVPSSSFLSIYTLTHPLGSCRDAA